ncbi:MAG TPA: LamG-like jellyroll fold domain-containing protein [Planctomycetota bacterium]|nr:LamG-like jellyroll fold domain-containing protein [Planctomycetota bacterium]
MAQDIHHRGRLRRGRRRPLALLALLVIAVPGWGASYVSAGSGNWNTTTTWTPNGTPGSGDTVSIGAHTITLVQGQAIDGITFTAAGTITGAFTLTLGGSATVSVASGVTGTIASVVDGTAGLTKTATGQLTLSAVNTYSGTTTVDAGTLDLNTLGGTIAQSASILVKENATLQVLRQSSGTHVSPDFFKNDCVITMHAGTLSYGGSFAGNRSETVGSIVLERGHNRVYVRNNGWNTTLTAASGLTRTNNATMTFEHEDTPSTGNTNQLILTGLTAIVRPWIIRRTPGSTMYPTIYDLTSGVVIESGTLHISNQTRNWGHANAWTSSATPASTDSVQISSHTMTLNGDRTLKSAHFTGAGGIDGANRLTITNFLGGYGTGSVTCTNLDFGASGVSEGVVIRDGTGTMTISSVINATGFTSSNRQSGILALSGTNVWTGTTTITSGTLQVAGSSIPNTSPVVLHDVATAILSLNNSSETVGSIAGGGALGGNIALGTGTLTCGGDNTTTTFDGVISGGGGLTKNGSGSLTLSRSSSYTGTTTVFAGTLEVTAANGSSAVLLNGTGTLGGTGTVGAISSAGSTAAVIRPGSTGSRGTLKAGATNLSAGAATVQIRVAGFATAGTSYDRLDLATAGGALTLGGSSTLSLDLSGVSRTGTATGVITCAGTPSGTFTTVNVSNNPTGYSVTVRYNTGSVDIVIGAAPRYWDGGGADNNWSTALNWSGDAVPNTETIATFSAAYSNKACTVDAAASTYVSGIAIIGAYTGTITQGVPMHVIGPDGFVMSAASATYTCTDVLYTRSFAQTAGTYSTSGTLCLIAGGSGNTLRATSTINHLEIEGLDSGLVGYWKLDEASGTTSYDWSGNARHGTYNGPTVTATHASTTFTNVAGRAFTQASGHHVAVPHDTVLNLSSAYTISMWHRPTTGASQQFLVYKVEPGDAGGYKLLLARPLWGAYFGGQLVPGNAEVYGPGSMTQDGTAWHHVALQWDGSYVRLFVNGVQSDALATSAAIASPSAPLWFGTPGVNGINGLLDEVRFHSRALSAPEIASLASGTESATASAGTITLAANLNVAGDVEIHSGTLALAGFTLDVKGSWTCYGALDTTGTVALTGTGAGKTIRSGEARFNHLQIASSDGTGVWTLQDALDVAGTLTIATGQLDVSASSHTIRCGSLNQTGASSTLNARSGTIVMESATGGTIRATTTLNALRIEDATETDLRAYWKFDEASGLIERDHAGNGNHGTLLGSAMHSVDKPATTLFANDGSTNCDGTHGCVRVADHATLRVGGALTLATWVNPDVIAALDMPVVQKRSLTTGTADYNYGLWITTTGRAFFQYSDGSYRGFEDDTGVIATGTWTHLAVVADETADTVTFYRNGVATKTLANTWTMPDAGTAPLEIGRYSLGAWAFDGKIDDVRIYGRALTAAEIGNLANGRYANGASGTATVTLAANLATASLGIDAGLFDANGFTTTVTNAFTLRQGQGTYTAGSGTQTFNGGLTISGSTFTGGAGTIDINGSFTQAATVDANGGLAQSGGTFTASSGTMSLTGSFTRSSSAGTFAHNSGTLVLDGTAGGQGITSGGASFDDVQVTGAGGWTINDAFRAEGAMTVSNGVLAQAAGATITIGGAWAQSAGTFTGSTTGTTSEMMRIGGAFALSGTGAFTSTRASLVVGGDLAVSAGTFTHNSGTVLMKSATSRTLTCAQAFNHLAFSDGLVAQWRFEEAATAAVDASGYGHTATWFNGPTPSTTVKPTVVADNARALAFDGSDDYLNVADGPEFKPTNKLTVCTWWRKPTAGASFVDEGGIFGRASGDGTRGWSLQELTAEGELFFRINHSLNYHFNVPFGGFARDRWHHVAVTFDSTTLIGYRDGVQIYANAIGAGTIANPTNAVIWIGRQTTHGAGYSPKFGGALDDLRFYDRDLSAADVRRLAAGREAASSVATFTLATNVTAAGNLTIGSGTLDLNSRTVGVGGSWSCGGVLSAGTSTVTFNGTGHTGTILSGEQRFANVVVAGSGSDWTCVDDFRATGAFTQSASIFRGNTYRVRIDGDVALNGGTFQATSDTLTFGGAVSDAGGGTFAANGGTAKLTSAIATTVTMADAFNDLVVQGGGDAAAGGLVAHLRLDEPNGAIAYDASGNARHATYTNTPTPTTTVPTLRGTNPRALSLSGGTGTNEDYVTLAGTDTIHTGSYTLSAWFYPTAVGGTHQSILTKAGWNIGLMYSNVGYFVNELWLANGQGNPGAGPYGGAWSAITYAPGSWYHVAGVVDLTAGTNVIYVNGVAAGSTNNGGVAGHAWFNGQSWRVGQAAGGYLATGNVDDVRIYDRALGADEVLGLARGFDGGSTSSAAHTLGAALDVDGDIALVSGGLALGAFDAAVADNWLNFGASFSGAGRTVTFDGTAGGPHTIRSGEESFGNVAVTGSRTWQLGDRFTASGSLTIANGTVDVTSDDHAVRVGTMDQTAPGAFVAQQGTVILDSASDRTLRVATSSLWRLGVADVPAETSGVAHWTFDLPTGVIEPDLGGSGTSNPATLTGSRSTDIPTDVLANATSLYCAGAGTGARIADPGAASELDFTAGDSITIAAWIKPVSSAANAVIATKGDRHPAFYVGNGAVDDGRLSFFYRGVGADPGFQTPTSTITYGAWQHVAVVCTPGTASSAKFYVDGAEIAGGTWTGGTGNEAMLGDNGAEWRIGTYDLTATRAFNGRIDDVRIYRRILGAAEIAAIAEDGPSTGASAANATSLVSYLALDDGAGATTSDRASAYAAKTGTRVNTTWSIDVPATRFANAASLAFDGAGDYLVVPDPGVGSELDFANGEQITIAAWVKAADLSGNRTIAVKGRYLGATDTNFAIRTTNGFLEFYYYSAWGWEEYVASTNALSTGAWTHVAATCTLGTGASARLYVGGTLVTTAAWEWGSSGNMPPTVMNDPLVLGSITGSEEWNGLIDDVRIYRGTLTAAEIAALAGGAWDGQSVGAATWTMLAPLDVDEDLRLHGGRLAAGSHAITVGGDWRNRAGADALLPGTGLVTLNGTDQRLYGSTVFNAFTKSTAGATLTFPAGEPQWFLGGMTIAGSSGSLLTLASSTPGTQGIVVPYGARACTWLRVQDSWNQIMPVIGPTFSSSGDNHTNWFGPRTRRGGPVAVGYPPLH